MKRMTEMKKKLMVMTGVAAAAVLIPASVWAEEVPELTMEQVVEANMAENLLKHYDSYYLKFTSANGETEMYKDAEMFYYANAAGEYLRTDSIDYDNFDNGEYTKYMYVEREPFVSDSEVNSLMNVEVTLEEEIQEIKQEGENIIFSTKLPEEWHAEIAEAMGVELLDGDYPLIQYTLDAKTYAVLKSSETIMHKDGTEGAVFVTEAEYNAERPEAAKKLLDRATATENIRTLTIIANPGTDQEKEYKETVLKGEKIVPYFPDDTWKLYTDAECTQEKTEPADLQADATYYAKSTADATEA